MTRAELLEELLAERYGPVVRQVHTGLRRTPVAELLDDLKAEQSVAMKQEVWP